MLLFNNNGDVSAETIFDLEDYDRISKHQWCLMNTGYTYSSKIKVLLHRFILQKEGEVDHINRNKLDNRKSNLRICSRSQNTQNKKKRKNSTSEFVGVSKIGDKWKAQIQTGGITFNLGNFSSEVEAALIYNNKAIEIFGDSAHINEVSL